MRHVHYLLLILCYKTRNNSTKNSYLIITLEISHVPLLILLSLVFGWNHNPYQQHSTQSTKLKTIKTQKLSILCSSYSWSRQVTFLSSLLNPSKLARINFHPTRRKRSKLLIHFETQQWWCCFWMFNYKEHFEFKRPFHFRRTAIPLLVIFRTAPVYNFTNMVSHELTT